MALYRIKSKESGKRHRGLVFVYTGNGKGKTTAAFGMALRAIGYGRRVLVVQFMKGRESGEVLAAGRYLPGLTVYKGGRHNLINKKNPSPLDIEMARQTLEMARQSVESGNYDLIILDEINVAIDYNLVPLEKVLKLIKCKPAELDLGLTGRNAAPEIMAVADLVTEMREIKHPFSRGIHAKRGFDF